MGLRDIAIVLYRERNTLCEHLVYISLTAYFLATFVLLLWRSSRIFKIYFWVCIVSVATFVLAFYQATGGLVEGPLVFLLLATALTIQIQLQIVEENKSRHLALPKVKSQLIAMRHWLIILFGALLLLVLNAGGSILLTLLAKRTTNEVTKDILLWLRAPVALYICMVLSEFLRTSLLRLQLLATPVSEGIALKTVEEIAQKFDLRFKRLYRVHLEEYDYNCVIGHKGNIFLNESIIEKVKSEELEFLVVRGLIDVHLNLENQRILHYTIFSVMLFLPYFILGQTLDYFLPLAWALPVWKLLYILLFTTQHILKKGIDTFQFQRRSHGAALRVGLDEDAVRAIHLKLNSFNRLESKMEVIFGLPRANTLPETKPWTLHSYSFKVGKLKFTKAGRNALVFTAVLFVVSGIVLKSPYEFRRAAAEGDAARVTHFLDSGFHPDSVDVLSNVTPTPLLAATQNDHEKIVTLLLDHGADPNKKVPVNFSPLVFATMAGDLAMVKELISHGAKINYKGVKGYTALMWAARLKKLDIVKYLVLRGALLNARSDHHSSALMLALQVPQNSDVVRTLIEAGADIECRDLDGDTALEIAKRKHFGAELEWLGAALLRKTKRLPASK